MERRISDQEPNSFPPIFPVIVTRSSWCDGLPSPPSPFFSWWCERIWLVRANVAITDFKNLTSKMQNTICWLFGMKSHKSITKPENRSTFRPCMQLSIGHFTYHEFEAHLQGAPSRVAKTSVRDGGVRREIVCFIATRESNILCQQCRCRVPKADKTTE